MKQTKITWLGIGFVMLFGLGIAWASDYYNHGNFPSPSSPATSASMRAELDLIAAGFAKLPTLTGNASKPVIVNGGATGLTTTTGALSLAGNLSVTGAFNTTLAQTGTIIFTLPSVSGTAATLNGIETFLNKTLITPVITAPSGLIRSDVGLGNVDNTSDATKNAAVATLTNKSVADPTSALDISNKEYVDQHGFSTGDVKLTLKTTADTAWVLMNDGTIGDASCGCSTRANADTSALYTLLWTNVTDTWAPVVGGRGGSAAADFAAHKPLTLPKTLGRALAGYGTGVVVATGVDADVDITTNILTVDSNTNKWITGMPVVFTLQSGTITGLTTSTTYYVIRITATQIRLATTLANAQNATPIDFTAKSSPVWTVTHTYTTRVLGEAVGENTHAQSLTELLAHTHDTSTGSNNTPGATPNWWVGNGSGGGTRTTDSTGGNAAMNIMQPTSFLNVMVKL